MQTLFFYGSLRDRALLETVLGRPVDPAHVRAARAPGFAALRLRNEAYPHLAARPGEAAQGVVVGPLDDTDVARLSYFEEAEYGLEPIEVDTAEGPVRTRYFRATGKAMPTEGPWDFDAWARADRAVAIEAAAELMAHMGITPVERVDAIWGGIMVRARMRARAAAETPVTGCLRATRGPEDVERIAVERPYTRVFAIEDHRLRHRRFDGSWSPEIVRTAITSGDAVTVLPYDPARGEVLLIEQFRAPMLARGDTCPWGIEVVAGRIDLELDAEACARREALEEAGLTLGRMEVIARYYPTPGIAAEHITSFVGEADLSGEGGIYGLTHEHEDIRAFTVPLAQAMDAAASGEINNAPAVLSLLWLAQHAERLQAEWAETA